MVVSEVLLTTQWTAFVLSQLSHKLFWDTAIALYPVACLLVKHMHAKNLAMMLPHEYCNWCYLYGYRDQLRYS